MNRALAYGLMGAASGALQGLQEEWQQNREDKLAQAQLQEKIGLAQLTHQFNTQEQLQKAQLDLESGLTRDDASNKAKAALQGQEDAFKAGQNVLDRASEEQRSRISANAAIEAAKLRQHGGTGSSQVVQTPSGYALIDKATGKALPVTDENGTPVQAPLKTSAAKIGSHNAILKNDAINFAAAVTGHTPEEIAQMPAEQVRDLVANDSRLFTGPILGDVPFTGYDLNAYTNAAAGQQARINNPVGQVSNADFDIAKKSVFSQDKPAAVNAQLVYQALTAGDAPAAAGGAPGVSATPTTSANAILQEMQRRGLVQ